MDRKQKVFLNGTLFEELKVDCGVPQGSCLGPLLYAIFTNDIPFVLQNAKVSIYADDTTIYLEANSEKELNEILNTEIHLIAE